MSDIREKIEAEKQERIDFCRLLRNTVRKMVQSTLDRPSFGRVPMPDEILAGLDGEYSLLGSLLDPTKIGRDPQKITSEINEYGRQLRKILRKVSAKMHEIGDDARPYQDVDCQYDLATSKIVIHASIFICRPRNG